MPLTWGDGLAPVVGRNWGQRIYTVKGHKRSLEGSAGFFIAALLSTWLALWLVQGEPVLSAAAALLPALLIALITTLTEALSPWGLDNLTVTAASLVLTLWLF